MIESVVRMYLCYSLHLVWQFQRKRNLNHVAAAGGHLHGICVLVLLAYAAIAEQLKGHTMFAWRAAGIAAVKS